MRLELATVISCEPGGCRVMPLGSQQAIDTRYSALVLNRVRILPGQLVAVDMETDVPEVAWRWYRARVVESSESLLLVQDRERQISAARVAGLETAETPGDEVWVTGMSNGWEVHDRVADGVPADPDRIREQVLPKIASILAASTS